MTGTNNVNSTGAPGIHVWDVGTIDMTFENVTVSNSWANGVTLVDIGGGSFDITGTTTVHGANGPAGIGIGIDIDGSSGTFTFADVDIDTTTLAGVAVGVVFANPGTVNINGGTIANTGTHGAWLDNAGDFNLNNTTYNSITGFTVDVTGSTLSGSGNTAVPFSCNNGGGNTGSISFNGGADSCP